MYATEQSSPSGSYLPLATSTSISLRPLVLRDSERGGDCEKNEDPLKRRGLAGSVSNSNALSAQFEDLGLIVPISIFRPVAISLEPASLSDSVVAPTFRVITGSSHIDDSGS